MSSMPNTLQPVHGSTLLRSISRRLLTSLPSHSAALELLHSFYPSPLTALMEALGPHTRSVSRRKLDYKEPKSLHASLLQPSPTKKLREASPAALRVSEPTEILFPEWNYSLFDGGDDTQRGGPSTYRRRRSGQVLEKYADAVKNKRSLSLTTIGERILTPAERSISGSSPSPLETLASGSQLVSSVNDIPSEALTVACANVGPDLSNASQPLCGRANLHTEDSETAELSLSTPRCLDVMDMGSLLPRVDTAILYEGPYPSFSKPSQEECAEVVHRLSHLHGPLEEYAHHKVPRVSNDKVVMLEYLEDEGNKDTLSGPLSSGLHSSGRRVRSTVLDSLVGTILSQNTTDTNSQRAFASLKARFPTWELVFEADPKAVEDAIRCGGLAEIKSSRILDILRTLHQERGKLCLEYVRDLSTDEIKLELSRFKGVGPKTIACVLMFHLQQNEFPVDTHVFRITKKLGWVPAKADRKKAYLHLNHRIPDYLKFDLHCLLVTHGKRCPVCAKGGRTQRPADGPCPLVNLNQTVIKGSQCDLIQES